jgi:hypothetical protein
MAIVGPKAQQGEVSRIVTHTSPLASSISTVRKTHLAQAQGFTECVRARVDDPVERSVDGRGVDHAGASCRNPAAPMAAA